jgi:hypothetical protein
MLQIGAEFFFAAPSFAYAWESLDHPEIQKVGYPVRLDRQVPEIESGRMTTAMARGYC